MAKTSGKKTDFHLVGFVKVPNSLFLDKRFTIYDKMILIILKKYSFNTQFCFPSHEIIALEAGVSIDTVIRSLNKLRSLGVISWYKHGRHNSYKIELLNENE